jgi:hypothetical protein
MMGVDLIETLLDGDLTGQYAGFDIPIGLFQLLPFQPQAGFARAKTALQFLSLVGR